MNVTKRIEALEQRFSDHSENAQNLLAFLRSGFADHFSFDDVFEMKTGLLMDTNSMFTSNLRYRDLSGSRESHPDYQKFMGYMRTAGHLLDENLLEKM